MSCKEFIFKGGDKLEYIANDNTFNEIYKTLEDPWNQTDENDIYYKRSRKIVSLTVEHFLKCDKEINILEIGCGNGFSTYDLKNKINRKNINYYGCDISDIAIEKAKKYKDIKFFTHDIKKPFKKDIKYDFIIISNLLWYILEYLEISLKNSFDVLNEEGKIVFYSAFVRDQRYGNHIISGFEDMKNFLIEKFPNKKILKEINEYNKNKEYYRYLVLFVLN